MDSKPTILITAVGSGVSQSIIKALRLANEKLGRTYYLIGTDMQATAAGLYRVDRGYMVPGCSSPDYLEKIITIIRNETVDVVIPGSDPEVLALSENRSYIEDATEATVLVSPVETVKIGIDKWETYRFLRNHGFSFPQTFLPEDVDSILDCTGFPIIAKPRRGSGSVGLYILRNKRDFDQFLPSFDDTYIIQEYLMPDDSEYTTGIVFDCKGNIIDSITMLRKLKKGASYFARVVDCGEVLDAMEAIASHLEVRGAINLQCRVTDRGPVVFELNPRFSGTTAARAVAGLNEPDISIRHLLMGETPGRAIKQPITMMRHLMEIYIPNSAVEEMERDKTTNCKADVYGYF